MIQYYETGNRGEKKVVIPKTVELACYALSVGVEAFDGAAAANAGRMRDGGYRGRSSSPILDGASVERGLIATFPAALRPSPGHRLRL